MSQKDSPFKENKLEGIKVEMVHTEWASLVGIAVAPLILSGCSEERAAQDPIDSNKYVF